MRWPWQPQMTLSSRKEKPNGTSQPTLRDTPGTVWFVSTENRQAQYIWLLIKGPTASVEMSATFLPRSIGARASWPRQMRLLWRPGLQNLGSTVSRPTRCRPTLDRNGFWRSVGFNEKVCCAILSGWEASSAMYSSLQSAGMTRMSTNRGSSKPVKRN